jgi:Domain of unknown function (DUF4157)
MIAEPIRKMLSVVSEPGSKQHNRGVVARSAIPRPADKALPSAPTADFFDVRLHPDAAEVTAPLQARAVTRGQDVYFHPGQFQPGTPHGEGLIAHELAHTLQTRHSAGGAAGGGSSSFVSQPGDAFERNADALVRGETSHALAAPAGAALRGPFDSENATDRARRERLIQSISNASNSLIHLLQTRGLIQNTEVEVTRHGTQGVIYGAHTANTPQEVFTSYADRDVRIRRIIRELQAMATQYRSQPVPSAFTPPTYDPTQNNYSSTVRNTRGTSSYNSSDQNWVDLEAAYERYCVSQGMTPDQYENDWYYLDPANTITPGAAHGAHAYSTGIQTGVFMVVPDIDHEPLNYWRLTGTSPTPKGSVIVELWHDQLGYYYMNRGQRIDVPNPHTTP